MIVFGLTGGIASGKSTVAVMLSERGAVVLDADRHAHKVLAEPEVVQSITERWGQEILDEQGGLKREAIAQRVFGDDMAAEGERQFLEGLVHPRVRQRLNEDLAAAHMAGAPAVVLDIPLLHEAGWADECDAVLYVDTPEGVRQERAAARGWSEEQLRQREAAQLSTQEKADRADEVIPGGNLTDTQEGVARVWRRWVVNG